MAVRRHRLGAVDRPSDRYHLRLTDPATDRRVSGGTFSAKADAEKALAAAVAAQDEAPGSRREPPLPSPTTPPSGWGPC